MTGRKTASSITDPELTELYDDLDRYEELQGDMNERAIDLTRRAEQLEDLLSVAHDTSNRSEAERAKAVQRAEHAEEMNHRLLQQRQEMAAERYAWQERGDRAEAVIARVRALADECETNGYSSGHPLTVTHIRDALNTSDRPASTATQAADRAGQLAALAREILYSGNITSANVAHWRERLDQLNDHSQEQR